MEALRVELLALEKGEHVDIVLGGELVGRAGLLEDGSYKFMYMDGPFHIKTFNSDSIDDIVKIAGEAFE